MTRGVIVYRSPFALVRSVALCVAVLLGTGADLRADAPALSVFPEQLSLTGSHDGRQIIVSAPDGGHGLRDVTRDAHYRAEPPGIVRVTTEGYVRPDHPGQATITVEAAGQTRSVAVTVRDLDDNRPLDFANDIEPLLTRHGCNAGGCHGKASGQNGFKLSLLGFDPKFDHDAIVKEARGRRLFPAAPERSMLLAKPAGLMPHGGGKRFDSDSETYHILLRWITQGAPAGDDRAPTLKKLEVVPAQRVLDRGARQQLAVLAQYSDGSIRDVTRQAQYQSNEIAVAAVDEDGLVRTLDLAGETAVMARYMGQVVVFRATVPLGKPVRAFDFPAANTIDRLALAKWQQLGLVPSDLCTDQEFIRRVTLDLCGKLPTTDEVRAFLADRRPDRRARLIDRCLDSRDYAAFFAMRWGSILRNTTQAGGLSERAAYAFSDWLRDSIADNRPYDEFVRGIVTATGDWQEAPAMNWYWQMTDDLLHQPTTDCAQVFLGLRLQCARCHHHPYERWSQDDYYGLAGFFARLGTKQLGQGDEVAYFPSPTRTTDEVNPRTGRPLDPKLLDGPVLNVPPEEDPRQKLVDWMVRPDNPFFARALVNRMWSYLMGRGLVDPVDDMRATNPPSNPELLDALAKEFIAHQYDVKHLLRTICNSRTYQLSSAPNEYNRQDRQNHARYYARRLMAEVLLDAVDQTCGTHTAFNKVRQDARAVDLPHDGFDSFFLDVFNRPQRITACECARGSGASLSQVLHLANSPEVEDKIAAEDGRVARLMAQNVPPDKAVEELYLAALARYPTADEKKVVAESFQGREQKRVLEDLLWTLLNSREFLFNH
jgi:hypothetical protein